MKFFRLNALMTSIALAITTQAAALTISAAASLKEAFKDIATEFEAKHSPTKVSLNFGASGALLQQITQGAPVDVFASADLETMDEAQKKGLIETDSRRDFARNTLVVIVPIKQTAKIERLDDLNQKGIKRIAIGNPTSVPAGRYSQHALEKANLWSKIQDKFIKAENVRQALDYVARGEVDAGFVYETDAALMKDKVKVAFTVPLDKTITYPIAKIKSSAHSKEATNFINFVMSPKGVSILEKHGFKKP